MFKSLVFDHHGLGSKNVTEKFVKEISCINPDIVHLHNIHGYYMNYPVLFNCLEQLDIPVVWTFHDCWPFTGHCSYFDSVGCEKWKIECHSCPKTKAYPKSLFLDNSRDNFISKKKFFTSLEKMHVVTPSNWLAV